MRQPTTSVWAQMSWQVRLMFQFSTPAFHESHSEAQIVHKVDAPLAKRPGRPKFVLQAPQDRKALGADDVGCVQPFGGIKDMPFRKGQNVIANFGKLEAEVSGLAER